MIAASLEMSDEPYFFARRWRRRTQKHTRCAGVAVRTIGTNVSVIPLSILTLSKFGGASAVNKQVFHCSWLARTFNFQFSIPQTLRILAGEAEEYAQ